MDLKREIAAHPPAYKKGALQRTDSIEVNDLGLTFHVTYLDVPDEKMQLESSYVSSLGLSLRSNYCRNNLIKRFRELDIAFTYLHYAANGKLLFELSINPNDCNV